MTVRGALMERRASRASESHGVSAESELLLAAACLHPGVAEVGRAHAAMTQRAAIDWERFVPLARHHGVLPLLYRHLTSGTFDARLVPDAALLQLRRAAERVAQRSLILAGELVSLLGALERDGIRVVPLKGPVLAQQLYGSVSLRRINDLDLLVAEEDAERAAALIGELGFSPDASWTSDALGAMHRDVSHHVCLRSATKSYRVELHYYLLPPAGRRRFALSALESDLELVTFFGERIRVMRPEALLVYLCKHGTHHAWGRIEWIGGIAELLRAGRISDWTRVADAARRLDAERALGVGLQVVQQLFDVPTPAIELRSDRASRAATRAIVTRLRRHPARLPGGMTTLAHHVRIDSGWRSRVRRMWSVLFVSTLAERAAFPLPRALTPIYYLLHPVWIVMRRIRRLAASR